MSTSAMVPSLEDTEPCELIFFETFAHDSDEKMNLDLVQFRSTNVRIEEIRIVPLGAKVEANFPNGHRLGATNPSSFDIQFFVNDLTRPDISTFTEIGKLSYEQNDNTQLIVSLRKVTDGLLIRGRYRTLTIAVFGVVVGNTVDLVTADKEDDTVIEPALDDDDDENILGDKRQEVIDAIMQRLEVRVSGSSERKNVTPFSPDVIRKSFKSPSVSDIDSPMTDKVFKQSPYDSIQVTPNFDDLSASNFSDVKTPRSSLVGEDISMEADETTLSSIKPIADDLENISPGNSISGDEIDEKCEDIDLETPTIDDVAEAISSDDDFEDFVDERDEEERDEGMKSVLSTTSHPNITIDEILDPISSDEDDIELPLEVDYNDKSDYLKPFDISALSLESLKFFTRKKIIKKEMQEAENRKFLDQSSAIGNVKEHPDLGVKWVELMETEILHYDAKLLSDESTNIIIEWLLTALDFGEGFEQLQPAMRVRQLKAVIRLIDIVFSSSRDNVEKLISRGGIELLLKLYKESCMTLPLKLAVLKSLDSLGNSTFGMNRILNEAINTGAGENTTVYQWLLKETMENESSRILSAIAALIKKGNFHENIVKLQIEDRGQKIQKLQNIHYLLAISPTFMSQPQGIFPTQTIFETKVSNLSWNSVLDWFEDHKILDQLDELLQVGDDLIKKIVTDLFVEIIRIPKGVHFLLESDRNVLKTTSILSSISSLNKKLHCQIAQTLHVTCLFDSIVSSIQKDGHVDASNPESGDLLHSLFMSLFSWSGRMAIVHLLKDNDHLTSVIKIIKYVSKCNGDEEIIFEYFSRILVDYIRFQDDDVLEIIRLHGNDLMELSRMKDKPVFASLSSYVANFITLVPFTYTLSKFQVLSNILKKGIDQEVRKSLVSLPSIPAQIITCLRVLNQVCIPPPSESVENPDIPKQLKYKYGIVQMFSSECYHHIISLLNQITTNHLLIPHVSLFTDSSFYSVLNALKLSTTLISSVIHSLIRAQGNSFQDVTVIQPLLRVYCLLSHVPSDHESNDEVTSVKECIIYTISMFCKIPEIDSMDDSQLMKSIWTKAVGEILNFILSSPVTMRSGLQVMVRILPDDTQTEDTNENIMLVNLKKLWVVHISPFKEQIEQLGSCLCCCSDKALREDVLMVLTKLTNLSPETSIIVVQSFMSSLSSVRFKRPQLQGYLWLFIHLVQDCSFKVTLIFLIRQESIKKESNFLHDLLLLSNPHDTGILMEIISHLLMTGDQQLFNQFPKEAINTIIIFNLIKFETGSLVDSPTLADKAFKILSKFCESDLGLHQLRINLKSSGRKVLSSFLDKLVAQLIAKKDSSSGVILKSFISFFTLLIKSSEETGFGLKSWEVRDLLKTPDNCTPDPVDNLLRYTQQSLTTIQAENDDFMTCVKHFVALMQKPSGGLVTIQPVEPKEHKAESIQSLFSRVNATMKIEIDESSGDIVEVDLVTLGRCVSGLDFNLSKNLKEQMSSLEPSKKVLVSSEKKQPTLQLNQLVISAKTIVSPNRGRGRGTGPRFDPFRTRPPNTSRPPSMHVDDFVAMEKESTVTANRRMKDFQGHRTSSAPSPSYSSLSVDTRNVVQKGASFTHRSSPYLSPRAGPSNWSKNGQR